MDTSPVNKVTEKAPPTLLVRALFDIPLVVTLHSLEPLRPWKAEQLGRGYEVSSWAERAAVEAYNRLVLLTERAS